MSWKNSSPSSNIFLINLFYNVNIQPAGRLHMWLLYLKKGDKSLPSNNRSKSLIICVGKIMERVIYKYVFNHLQRKKLIYEYQSGFLPKYSTVHQLLEM